MNALNNQGEKKQNSINEKIKECTNQTKLNKIFSDWSKENDSISELFKKRENDITTNGGTNVKQQW